MVRSFREQQTSIFLTQNGDGERVFSPIELDLLAEMLRRERSMLAGSRPADMSQMRAITEELFDDDPMAL